MDHIKNLIIKKDRSEFKNDFKLDCPAYDYMPSVLPAVRRIVVIGDVHGDYDLTIKLLKIAKVINDNVEWIGTDTHIVQVGDQIDRCRQNGYPCNHKLGTHNDEASDIRILKFLTELHLEAKKVGGAVISLLGNHELMNVLGDMTYVSYLGLEEFESYIDPKYPNKKFESGLEARQHAFRAGNEYGTFLGCTRLASVIIGSNLFIHAGIIPEFIEELNSNVNFDLHISDKFDMEKLNLIIRKWLLKKINKKYVSEIISGSRISMFWNRILGNIPPGASMKHQDCSEYLKPVLKLLQIGNMIIGHTPQFTKDKGMNGACDNTLWRVDAGSSNAFYKFDKSINSGSTNIDAHREPQVLEILNDVEFNVLQC
jgi:hypothetical protein